MKQIDLEEWLKQFQLVETWQVVLDMPSKDEAVKLARHHETQRGGGAAVQVLHRYVKRDDVEVVNEDWREKE